VKRNAGDIRNIVQAVAPGTERGEAVARLHQELRLAALLHDTGHSAYSHSSESVYENLDVLRSASRELTSFTGKEKGAGEVLSFCLANTESLARLLARAGEQVDRGCGTEGPTNIDLGNVALIIVGRSRHPFLQFLGDIVSSGFDADKLDYLLRDAAAAGLPLRYDLDRYLYAVRLAQENMVDGAGHLQKLYRAVAATEVKALPPTPGTKFPYFETYRLRLPRQAMNAIEQIVICKLFLFSYVYHHAKVRAADGTLQRVLTRMVSDWRSQGKTEGQILEYFLDMTDSVLRGHKPTDALTTDYLYRLANRLLPREVYSLGADVATHAERPLLTDFLTSLQDRETRDSKVEELEQAIGEELLKADPTLGRSPRDAVAAAGVWVDVPRPPRFEDVEELVIGGAPRAPGVPLTEVFPIGQWTEAYTHFRYRVRIFSFSEHRDKTQLAAKRAMQKVIKIAGDSFYERVKRTRM
jgi:HD superfamily phosphohydrolase